MWNSAAYFLRQIHWPVNDSLAWLIARLVRWDLCHCWFLVVHFWVIFKKILASVAQCPSFSCSGYSSEYIQSESTLFIQIVILYTGSSSVSLCFFFHLLSVDFGLSKWVWAVPFKVSVLLLLFYSASTAKGIWTIMWYRNHLLCAVSSHAQEPTSLC